VPALRGVSFSVQKGEFVTVVGPSGSGKSTLFYLLGGLTRADSGSVTIDGVDFATLSDGERTRLRKSKIGFVFQKFNLLPTLSARSNIEIAVDIAGMAAPDPVFLKKITEMLGIAHVWSIGRTSFPAASSRESRSPALSSTAPPSCSPTSPPATWIRKARASSSTCCASRIRIWARRC
jgi:ABC-type multidrug transport system ATPase subunit